MLKEIDVVILCGGIGSRLRGTVDDRPKSMVQINQQPFLDILIDYFCGFGFSRFVLCTGHMSEVIQEHYSHKKGSLEFIVSNEQIPLGTAGSIKNAERFIQSEPFLVTNGDSFCPMNLAEFYDFHLLKQALMSMAVVESEDTSDCGLVTLDNLQRISGFEEKKAKARTGYINVGIYLFQKKILSFIPANTKYSLEYDLFPKLTNLDSFAFVSRAELIDIGTPERYERASSFFSIEAK
ncbi:MAG: NTP transferase domain-containing protein [Planctomycetes bacterium]|nr:NTP transferase domain-containing protein [Planctomycetota bacterium]